MDLDPTEFPSPFDNVVPASQAKTYHCQFLRVIDVDVQAENIVAAEKQARALLAQFVPGSLRLLSVIADGYVEPAEAPKTADLNERRNAQLAVRVRELTDQPEPDRVA